jgi:hypothetical protein
MTTDTEKALAEIAATPQGEPQGDQATAPQAPANPPSPSGDGSEGQGTDPDQALQTPEGSKDGVPDSDAGDDDDNYDPVKAAVDAAIEADRWERDSRRQERDAKRQTDGPRPDYGMTAKAARQYFENLVIETEDGEKVRLTPDQIAAGLKHFDTYNLEASRVSRPVSEVETEVYSSLGDQFYEALPPRFHDQFTEQVKEHPNDLSAWVETYRNLSVAAYISSAIDSPESLEKLAENSPKLKAAVAKMKADEYERGRRKGQKDPNAEPRLDGSAVPGRDGEYPRDDTGNIDTAAVLGQLSRS